MSEWKEYKLGEVITLIGGGTPKTKMAEYWNGNIPWLSVTDFNTGHKYVYTAEKKITELGLARSSTKILKKGQLIISARGTVGVISMLGKDMAFNQSNYGIDAKKDFTENNFLYYSLINTVPLFLSNSYGAVFDTITKNTFDHIDIKLPPLPEQKAIAEVLSSLDDKIDLLHRQNKTLEQMAETLFRQWFVEEAEESWEEGRLGDILSLIESGKRPKGGIDQNLNFGFASIGAESINGIGNYNFSKTKYITDDFYKSLAKGIVQNYDVLIYKDGAYIGKKAMFGLGFPFKEFAINEHVFILRSNERANQYFLYFLLQKDELSSLNANSAQPGLNQNSMKNFEIIIPPFELIDEFGKLVESYVRKILTNSTQIRTLEKLRDTLLPKLMSGEVRVKYGN